MAANKRRSLRLGALLAPLAGTQLSASAPPPHGSRAAPSPRPRHSARPPLPQPSATGPTLTQRDQPLILFGDVSMSV